MVDISALTPAQQAAIKSGDTSGLSAQDKATIENIFKADGYTVTENGNSINFSKKTSKESSSVFKSANDKVIDDMTSLGKTAAKKFGETANRKTSDRFFYDSETQIIKDEAVAPEVNKTVDETKPTYDNKQGQLSEHNKDDCTLGVLKQSQSDAMEYLQNSRDPRISDLAKKSKGGDLASTYALIGIMDSWQSDMIQNAKDGKVTVDTANNVGGEPLKTGKDWVVPAEFCSEEDFQLTQKNGQNDPTPAKTLDGMPPTGEWRIYSEKAKREVPAESILKADIDNPVLTGLSDTGIDMSRVETGNSYQPYKVVDDKIRGGAEFVGYTSVMPGKSVFIPKELHSVSSQTNRIFETMDVDKDGFVTVSEGADKNHDGKLSDEEIAAIPDRYKDKLDYGVDYKQFLDDLANERNSGKDFESTWMRKKTE